MSWTDDRIETLRKLWADGLSASQIASALGGGVTRNAVIGKIHRLGLSGRVKAPTRTAPPRPRPSAPQQRPMVPERPRVMAVGATVVRVVEKPVPAPVVATLPEPQPAADVVSFPGGVSFTDLGANQCRWPVGDPSADDFRFCGSRTAPGETYCSGHAAHAFPHRGNKKRPGH